MYTNDRDAYRKSFAAVWQKHLQGLPLTALEASLAEVIALHPEFHVLLTAETNTDHFSLADNPFLHMGLHLALRDQIKLDRPAGITQIFNQLTEKYHNAHEAEHAMISCLAEILWQSQQSGTPPADEDYLRYLRTL